MPLKEGRYDIEKTEGPPECATSGLAWEGPPPHRPFTPCPPLSGHPLRSAQKLADPSSKGEPISWPWSSRWCVLFRLTQNHHISSQEAPGHFGEQVRGDLVRSTGRPGERPLLSIPGTQTAAKPVHPASTPSLRAASIHSTHQPWGPGPHKAAPKKG